MKKRITLVLLSLVCVLAITCSIVGCNVKVNELFKFGGGESVNTAGKELTAIKGKAFVESTYDGKLAIFEEQVDNGTSIFTQYSLYNLETESFLIAPTDSEIGFIDHEYGYYYVDSTFVINADSETTRTIYDASGAVLCEYDADTSYGDLDNNGFYSVNGEVKFFISPEDGSHMALSTTLANTMEGGYTYASDSYYVVYEVDEFVLSVYNRSDLKFVRAINLSEYDTSNASMQLTMTASGQMLMQVSTEVDPHSKTYDIIDEYGNQFKIASYMINLEKGKVSKKKLSFWVDELHFTLKGEAEGLAEGLNYARISKISKDAFVKSDYVILNEKLGIETYIDDIYEGASLVTPIADNLYMAIDANNDMVYINAEGETIAYNALLNKNMLLKGNSYFNLSGNLIYTISDTESLVGLVDGGVITSEWTTFGDTQVLIYSKNGEQIAVPEDGSLGVIADCFYTAEVKTSADTLTTTMDYIFYNGAGAELFRHISDDIYSVPQKVVDAEGCTVISIGTSYYKFS